MEDVRPSDSTDIATALADASEHLTFVERLTADLVEAPGVPPPSAQRSTACGGG